MTYAGCVQPLSYSRLSWLSSSESTKPSWFDMVWPWLSLVFLHQCAHLSKEFQKQTTAGYRFKMSSMVSLLLEKDDSNKSLPIYLGQIDESRSICLVLMISAWLKPNQAYMTSCCQGHGSSHRLVTWPSLWSSGSHSVLEIKWLKNQRVHCSSHRIHVKYVYLPLFTNIWLICLWYMCVNVEIYVYIYIPVPWILWVFSIEHYLTVKFQSFIGKYVEPWFPSVQSFLTCPP